MPSVGRLELREIPASDVGDSATSSASIHRVFWDSEVDGEFTVSAQEIEELDRTRSVGGYIFLEQLDRVPLVGGVALTGLLPIPGSNR
jgi:hypothetical protein